VNCRPPFSNTSPGFAVKTALPSSLAVRPFGSFTVAVQPNDNLGAVRRVVSHGLDATAVRMLEEFDEIGHSGIIDS